MTRRETVTWGLLRGTTLTLVCVFLLAPVAVVAVMSLNSGDSVLRWEGLSLQWYAAALSSQPLMSSLFMSLAVAATATAIAGVLGTMLAIGVHRVARGPLLRALALLPAFVPDIVLGIGTLSLFALFAWKIGFTSVVVAHAAFEIAIVAAFVLARLGGLDPALEEASANLGATRLRTFRRIVLPQLMPSILAGCALGFSLSLDEFIIAFFTTAAGSQTLPIQVYSMVRFGVSPEINALATMLLVVTIVIILAVQRALLPLILRRKP